MSQRSRPISTAQLEDGRAARGHSKGARHGCERAHRRTFAAPRDATAAIRVIAVLEELRPLIPPRPARSESAAVPNQPTDRRRSFNSVRRPIVHRRFPPRAFGEVRPAQFFQHRPRPVL